MPTLHASSHALTRPAANYSADPPRHVTFVDQIPQSPPKSLEHVWPIPQVPPAKTHRRYGGAGHEDAQITGHPP